MATLKLAGVFAGAFAMLASTAPVMAAPATETPMTMRVEYGDLDLSTSHDQARLEKRIKHAVRVVCGPDNATVFADSQAAMKCQILAMAKAKKDVSKVLTRYDNGQKLASNQ